MIQRIQSFWLVLAACCMALCFMFPVAKYHFTVPQTQQQVMAELNLIPHDAPDMYDQILQQAEVVEYSQKMSGFHTWWIIAMVAVVGVIALVSIFLYGNRVRQLRVVAVGFLVNVVYVFLLFFWVVDAYGKTVQQAMATGEANITWFVGAYAPIVSLVFFILAHRGIKKDEEKVRAADRLR